MWAAMSPNVPAPYSQNRRQFFGWMPGEYGRSFAGPSHKSQARYAGGGSGFLNSAPDHSRLHQLYTARIVPSAPLRMISTTRR